MKLAAIYNLFDGLELLKGSMKQLDGHVDCFILVHQTISNFGEKHYGFKQMTFFEIDTPIHKIFYVPPGLGGLSNETAKRQLGIDLAKEMKCTHFLHMDTDEYYQDFPAAKQEYIDTGHAGSVCKMFTYFKKPTWRLQHYDNYFVPFIHRLDEDTITGVQEYPFYVDPTRRINQLNVAMLEHTIMHHFSYVRKDIDLKVRNSSAKKNIMRSTLLADHHNLQFDDEVEGYFVEGFGQNLTVVENLFNISV